MSGAGAEEVVEEERAEEADADGGLATGAERSRSQRLWRSRSRRRRRRRGPRRRRQRCKRVPDAEAVLEMVELEVVGGAEGGTSIKQRYS